ncbi:hypothetical protein CAPTEDRAFT_225813 [Capitella teleta]|uniref:Sulfotransferase domain-containing protein n=1 Tax=Capitella teleta TaxID=283909 RepID=R7UMS2_CAPTE|nr:hypothetical protein CAPTEDRAFT_225813 [Capitella teleta]|eukprot:ELU04552.1 hypothetical protein CAPTEDRAFT_225813 [Capitella teleta]
MRHQRDMRNAHTRYYTGAIYKDPSLVDGFPGEGKQSRDCIVVKTHWPWYKGDIDNLPYKRAVLIVREPLAAIQAEFKRHSSGHGSHTNQLLKVDPNVWHDYVEEQLQKYLKFHRFWFSLAATSHYDMFILFYEDLKLTPRRALSNLGHFLGIADYSKHLDCVLSHSEGSYHRKPTRDPFENLEQFPLEIAGLKFHLNQMVQECISQGRCVTSGTTHY